ncbi:MAG: hypothetical protein AAF704_07430 [Cyanobacteria bacterium P01_D01_bin.123]
MKRQSGRTPSGTQRKSQPQPDEAAALQQVISSLNLDVVRELQHFRQWHQASGHSSAVVTPSTPSPTEGIPASPRAARLQGDRATSNSMPSTSSVRATPAASSPARHASIHTPPLPAASTPAIAQPMLEDLDDEWSNGVDFPIPIPLALVGVTLAALMAGMGVSWLLSPGQPSRPPAATAKSQASAGGRVPIDLNELPLLPVAPDSGDRLRQQDRREVELASADAPDSGTNDIPTYRQSDLAADLPATRRAFDSPELAVHPAVHPGAAQAATLPRSLGTDLGEGTFVVLMTYQGDRSLERARQIEPSAFVKRLGDRTYVQLATFRQLEHARHLADRLSREGVPVVISQ